VRSGLSTYRRGGETVELVIATVGDEPVEVVLRLDDNGVALLGATTDGRQVSVTTANGDEVVVASVTASSDPWSAAHARGARGSGPALPLALPARAWRPCGMTPGRRRRTPAHHYF
jgi:hypothetical protein